MCGVFCHPPLYNFRLKDNLKMHIKFFEIGLRIEKTNRLVTKSGCAYFL